MSGVPSVLVVGLGAMGSAAACHLAAAGARVTGFDRWSPPHDLGSSGGDTRIIREAYFEHPLYVPFVRRAYELWRALERDTGRRLLAPSGGLMMGDPEGEVVRGALDSARTHGLEHEVLDAATIARRFPQFRPPEGTVAVWEPRAGVLDAPGCIAAHLEMARRRGAALHFEREVRAWRADGAGVRVETDAGVHLADRLVLAAGPWMRSLVPGLKVEVVRQALHWFEPRANLEALDRSPIWIVEGADDYHFYGFPRREGLVKVARHHGGTPADPDALDRGSWPSEVAALRERLAAFAPDLDGPLRRSVACMYTNTSDGHFVLDRHPEHAQVVVASPCSGHGFKFSSAIGEAIAALATDRAPRFDLATFGAARAYRPAGRG